MTQGGFELSLAVVGGTLSGAVVAALLGAPVGRWLHAAILPLLVALGAGKVAMMLGGDGQGTAVGRQLGDGLPRARARGARSRRRCRRIRPRPTRRSARCIVILVLLTLLTLGRFERRAGGVFLLGIAPVGHRAGDRRLDLAQPGGPRAAEHGPGARARRSRPGCCVLLVLNTAALSRRRPEPAVEEDGGRRPRRRRRRPAGRPGPIRPRGRASDGSRGRLARSPGRVRGARVAP